MRTLSPLVSFLVNPCFLARDHLLLSVPRFKENKLFDWYWRINTLDFLLSGSVSLEACSLDII